MSAIHVHFLQKTVSGGTYASKSELKQKLVTIIRTLRLADKPA